MDFICSVILHHCITGDIACCCHGYSGNHARASCHIRADFIPGRMSYTGVMSYPGGCHTRARCHIRADVLPGRDIITGRMSYLGCINDATPAIVGSSCRSSEDDWVYFERSSTCNVPVRFTLLVGNTCYLEDSWSGNLYVAVIPTFTATDTSAPIPKIDGNTLPYSIVVTADNVYDSSKIVTFGRG